MISAQPISVLLAEDHTVVRQGICALLLMDGTFRVVGEARTGKEAVEKAKLLKPEVILMDIAMPVLNGAEATRQILAAWPSAKIIVLSAHSDDVYVDRMIEVGVSGFIEKQTSAEILAYAIREVAKGRRYFCPRIAKRLRDARAKQLGRDGFAKPSHRCLTAREAEVLQLVAEGSANKQIADVLGISIKTVEKHRQHLMDKLDIHDTAGLTRHAIAAGIIENTVQLTIV